MKRSIAVALAATALLGTVPASATTTGNEIYAQEVSALLPNAGVPYPVAPPAVLKQARWFTRSFGRPFVWYAGEKDALGARSDIVAMTYGGSGYAPMRRIVLSVADYSYPRVAYVRITEGTANQFLAEQTTRQARRTASRLGPMTFYTVSEPSLKDAYAKLTRAYLPISRKRLVMVEYRPASDLAPKAVLRMARHLERVGPQMVAVHREDRRKHAVADLGWEFITLINGITPLLKKLDESRGGEVDGISEQDVLEYVDLLNRPEDRAGVTASYANSCLSLTPRAGDEQPAALRFDWSKERVVAFDPGSC